MIAEERKKRRRRANPAALPLLVIKVYCRTLIYEVPADASLGHPSVRRARRYPMMHGARSWMASAPLLSIGWEHLEEWIWESKKTDGRCHAESWALLFSPVWVSTSGGCWCFQSRGSSFLTSRYNLSNYLNSSFLIYRSLCAACWLPCRLVVCRTQLY